MNVTLRIVPPVLVAALLSAAVHLATAQPAAAPAAAASAASALPADPWPRQINLSTGTVLMYQPQVNQRQGNQIDFRSALAFMPKGAKQ